MYPSGTVLLPRMAQSASRSNRGRGTGRMRDETPIWRSHRPARSHQLSNREANQTEPLWLLPACRLASPSYATSTTESVISNSGSRGAYHGRARRNGGIRGRGDNRCSVRLCHSEVGRTWRSFRDDRVLLVGETADDHHSTLPGGWADVNENPAGAVAREVREEARVEVRPYKVSGGLGSRR